ncbi:alpha-1,2-fucosyltransferase [Labilibaculum sp.]|uniref:alpha-1,2-fucosyltransferase n=1 Tax=Labilibaculum sp. TaxID=2060723 RepID=UPI00356383D1
MPKSNKEVNYFTAIPNRGAGIGHQMANWIAGYWFAKQFGLPFAHIPFSTQKWEDFLGFGAGEVLANELIKSQGYKKVRLPLFDEKNTDEVVSIQKIIASYGDQKVVFVCEQDQFYRDQFGVMEEIKQKFHRANKHRKEQLIYTKENFNIAIHVRRGDIVIGQDNKNPNLMMRWQDNTYFEKVLSSVVENVKTDKPIAIYLFSQGVRSDFPEFEKFENIHYCLDMGAQDSFLHMACADLLVTSKSSFSYKPALLNKGIKVCPANFWHGYPKTKDFVMVNDLGEFVINDLN